MPNVSTNSETEHLTIVICQHVDSGKSTTSSRVLLQLDAIPERGLDKRKQPADEAFDTACPKEGEADWTIM